MQNTNRHAQSLYNSLLKYADKQAADEFASKFPLSKSAVFERKFEWAKDICAYLESEFDEETIKTIRMDCACGPSAERMGKLKRLYSTSRSLTEFMEKYNRENPDSTVWCEGDTLFFSYPVCYCPCVKRTDKPISKTWCYCTLGYTKRLFDYTFGCDTDVELMETVKTGGSRCLMKIARKQES